MEPGLKVLLAILVSILVILAYFGHLQNEEDSACLARGGVECGSERGGNAFVFRW